MLDTLTSFKDTEVVVIHDYTGNWEPCFEFIYHLLLLKQVLCLNGICFSCFFDIQILSFYVLGEKKSAIMLAGRN